MKVILACLLLFGSMDAALSQAVGNGAMVSNSVDLPALRHSQIQDLPQYGSSSLSREFEFDINPYDLHVTSETLHRLIASGALTAGEQAVLEGLLDGIVVVDVNEPSVPDRSPLERKPSDILVVFVCKDGQIKAPYCDILGSREESCPCVDAQ